IRCSDVIALRLTVRRLLACPSALAPLARQLAVRSRELVAANPAGGRGRLVESRDGHAEARTGHLNRARSAISRAPTERRDRHVAEAEDRLRALGSAMRDDGDAAAQANCRDRSSDRGPFRMRRDASNNPHHTLAQRKGELAAGRGGVVNETVDYQRRVWAHIVERLVDQQPPAPAGPEG